METLEKVSNLITFWASTYQNHTMLLPFAEFLIERRPSQKYPLSLLIWYHNVSHLFLRWFFWHSARVICYYNITEFHHWPVFLYVVLHNTFISKSLACSFIRLTSVFRFVYIQWQNVLKQHFLRAIFRYKKRLSSPFRERWRNQVNRINFLIGFRLYG